MIYFPCFYAHQIAYNILHCPNAYGLIMGLILIKTFNHVDWLEFDLIIA